MIIKIGLRLIFCSLIGLLACKPTPKPSQKAATSQQETQDIENSSEEDDQIQEFGRIVQIEDGVYPMFIISVEFPERELTQDFDLNVEAIEGLSAGDLEPMIDNFATIHYTSELENMLLDIHHSNKSLLGEYAPQFDAQWKSITGILEKADETTMGDLPDEIIVNGKNGNTFIFKEYITPEMVAVNGKEVTAFYEIRGTHTITKIVPSE